MKLGKSNKPKTPTSKTRARRRSPSQICVLPLERQQSKQPKGPEPNKKQPQKICQGHSGRNPLCHTKEQKHAANELKHPEL